MERHLGWPADIYRIAATERPRTKALPFVGTWLATKSRGRTHCVPRLSFTQIMRIAMQTGFSSTPHNHAHSRSGKKPRKWRLHGDGLFDLGHLVAGQREIGASPIQHDVSEQIGGTADRTDHVILLAERNQDVLDVILNAE